VPPPLPNGKVKTTDGKADLNVPSDDKDLDEQYEAEMRTLSVPAEKEVTIISPEQKNKNYYAGVRSGVVLFWIFTNFALGAAILDAGGLNRLAASDEDEDLVASERSKVYLAVVLWTVAALSLFRFLGCSWFLILRLFRGV